VVGQKLFSKISFPIIGVIVTLFFIIFNYAPMRAYPVETSTYPNGYTSPIWKENPILTGIEPLPVDHPLISNAPDILLLYTNRSAFYLSREPLSASSGVSIADQSRLSEFMTDKCAIMVLFDPDKAELYEKLPQPITSQDVLDLQSVYAVYYTSENGILLMDAQCSRR
jgi:hypothetical protein